jgi:hypothetical protein
MRKTKFFEIQSRNTSEMKRLRELQYENDLLKLLYTDLLAKTVVLKDSFIRGVREC